MAVLDGYAVLVAGTLAPFVILLVLIIGLRQLADVDETCALSDELILVIAVAVLDLHMLLRLRINSYQARPIVFIIFLIVVFFVGVRQFRDVHETRALAHELVLVVP